MYCTLNNPTGGSGALTGGTTATFQNGIATFDQMQIECIPGGNLVIQYTISLSGLGLEYELTTTQSVNFRKCSDGEILFSNQCFRCQNGTYSLNYNENAKVTINKYVILL